MKKITSIILVLLIGLNTLSPMTTLAIENGEVAVPVHVLETEIAKAMAFTPETELPVKSAILIEQSSGRVLYEKNADEPLPPASVTKIMSLLLIMEALERGDIALDDMVTCSLTASEFGGSQIWLKPGEEMVLKDLLKATAIASANDATVCLAEYIAGSETAFVALMNQRAKELGMVNTVFKCAAGLDNEGHVTTARDIALMSRELMKHEQIKEYTTTWMDSLRDGKTELVNTNRLVRFYEGATGLKTGTTSGAGSCLSATATRDGLELIAVIMGADTSDNRFASARSILDYGFATYGFIPVTPPTTTTTLPVEKGVEKTVPLVYSPPKGILLEKSKASNITQTIQLPEVLEAPIMKDQEIGKVLMSLDGEALGEYPILAGQDVEAMTFSKSLALLWDNLVRCE